MKLLCLIIFVTVLSAGSLCAGPGGWEDNPAKGRAELERQWSLIDHPTADVGIRGVFRFALEAAGLRWHPERVTAALRLARSMQDLDPASKTYGNFRWRYGQTGVFDANAVEFSMRLAGLLRVRFSETLPDDGKRLLDSILTDGIEGMHRHHVKPDYTNIYVMKAWNLIAAGESLNRPAIAAEGYGQLREWLRFTATHGITEYGAVTYYGVVLDSLALIVKYAGEPDGRAQAETALHYLWTDIAANWWQAGDRLSGANARSYDYLYGHGYLEAHTGNAGWLRAAPELENAGWLPGIPHGDLATYYNACRWVPPIGWTDAIRNQVPRVVVQRIGAEPWMSAVDYVGSHVTLASAGASHSSDDRTLVADIGDSPSVPQLTMFMDGRDDPYGTKKRAEAQGARKALHLTPFTATVQRGPELVQILSDTPFGGKTAKKIGGISCFLTQITVPSAAELWSGERIVSVGTAEQPAPIQPEAPVFVRLGDAVIAIRFLRATAVDGRAAPIDYIEDDPKLPARRLTVVHSAGVASGRGTTIVWIRVAEGLDDAGFAAFRKEFSSARASVNTDGDRLQISVAGEKGPLGLTVDLAEQKRIEMEGGESAGLLLVNGEELGEPLIGAFAH